MRIWARLFMLGWLAGGGGLLLVAAESAALNLVRNPAFEDGMKFWQIRFPEENETKYRRNHEWVEVVANPDGPGKCVQFSIPPSVAASEGVKVVTEMVELTPGKQYEFGADVRSMAPAVKIFLEGYRRDPEQTVAGDNQYRGFVRCYRKVIHVHAELGTWSTEIQKLNPPARYLPTHVVVKLYAFHPAGKVYFRNVILREVQKKVD